MTNAVNPELEPTVDNAETKPAAKKTTRKAPTKVETGQGHEFTPDPLANDTESIKHSVANHLLYSVGKLPLIATGRDWEYSLAMAVRDRMVERGAETAMEQYKQDVKRVYYMSMEFLIGRALSNGLLALGMYDTCKQALQDMGMDLEEVSNNEPDAALGNGGLGRLAACFLDSMATLALPGYGYGIRYDYGMFAQKIVDGRQVETPDHWLAGGNPWEFPRPEVQYKIRYGGRVERDGEGRAHWVGTEDIQAMAYDTLIPGYDTKAVVLLRLWSARATQDIELSLFNRGEYSASIEDKNRSENVSRVLYPDDSTQAGRELRLRQEFFFSSASLQDMVNRHLYSHPDLTNLADKIAVHLNDTHPAICVPELMRILLDEHGMTWDNAWAQCSRIFSYTNHTLMPEALETWPVEMMAKLLPRHLEIIFEINHWFMGQVRAKFGDDPALQRRMSIVDEDHGRRIRMGTLSIVASHKVNGVSKLHSDLMVQTIFADFAALWPERFTNMTNGITPRRWLSQCNPALSKVLDKTIGTNWRINLDELKQLESFQGDATFMQDFRAAKRANKERLAQLILKTTGVVVNPDSLFDVQIKRIHEYKRQLLNVLHVITRYNRILANPNANWVPRTVIFAGKSASAYYMAKLVIKLINDVARQINNDPRVKGLLKVVFIPNYRVSVAEVMMPAADLSEQISTAGTEASGTGNMKMALNGALTIGTMDGANIEIHDCVGKDNIFIFGLLTEQVLEIQAKGHNPRHYYESNPELRQVLDQIGSGFFSPEEPSRFTPIVDSLLNHGDNYLLTADYADYVATQERVDELYRQPEEWARRAMLNVANMGKFNSDRTIAEYAESIWHVKPLFERAAPKAASKRKKSS